MAEPIKGLHHITAVSGPPQENFNFYRNKLGLRFIKKTINFDDPFTYHLYYGNIMPNQEAPLHFSHGSMLWMVNPTKEKQRLCSTRYPEIR